MNFKMNEHRKKGKPNTGSTTKTKIENMKMDDKLQGLKNQGASD